MARWPREDVLHVFVSGGCGASHTRTVTQGQPDPDWYLECPRCEFLLRDDPQWAATKLEVPETPDQMKKRESLTKAKDRNLEEIQTYALAKMAGIEPDGNRTPAITKILCTNGHQNDGRSKFCSECGTQLVVISRGQLRLSPDAFKHQQDPEPEPELAKLPVSQLRRLAEERGLDPKQPKRQLVEALSGV